MRQQTTEQFWLGRQQRDDDVERWLLGKQALGNYGEILYNKLYLASLGLSSQTVPSIYQTVNDQNYSQQKIWSKVETRQDKMSKYHAEYS